MSVSYIRDYGPKLVENGYKLCAIAPGAKFPRGREWQKNPLTAQACRQHPADEGVGVLCGYEGAPVCAVDVDFYGTEAESDKLYDLLCNSKLDTAAAVYRVGQPGKFLLLFKAKGVWTKGTTRGFARPGDDRETKMEIMGRGQQVVIYGIHEKTKKPYSYPYEDLSGTPLTVPYSQLPEISLDEIDEFKRIFETYVQSIGFNLIRGTASPVVSASSWDMEDVGAFRTVGLSIDEIRSIFDKVPCDWDSYDFCREAGMRIHHETGGSADGLALFDELCQRSLGNYGGFEWCEKKWESFHRSDTGRAVTMWPLAKHAGVATALASELNEAGLVNRVLLSFGDCCAYLVTSKTWLYFNPETSLWEEDTAQSHVYNAIWKRVIQTGLSSEAEAEVNGGNEKRAETILAFQKQCKSRLSTVIANVMKTLSNDPNIAMLDEDFDRDSDFIAVKNGLVSLKTRTLVPNTPDRKMRRYCNVVFDPTAKCPTWEQCVSEWFESPAVAEYLQRVLGKMLDGDPENDSLYILVGEGANGKSSFGETIRMLMGSYAKSVKESTLFGRSEQASGGARADLMALVGKRFAICPETGNDMVLRNADVKRFTGRDAIAARALYSNREKDYTTQFTLFVSTNYEPELNGVDNAIRRRVKVIRFPRDYENDPVYRKKRILNLQKRLQAEMPGIFNWLLVGYQKAKAEGLNPPSEVVAASNAYVDSQDVVARWFEQCVEEKEGAVMPVKEAFLNFQSMLASQRENVRFSQNKFTSQFRKLLERKGHAGAIAIGAYKVNYLWGFVLRQPESEEDIQKEFD